MFRFGSVLMFCVRRRKSNDITIQDSLFILLISNTKNHFTFPVYHIMSNK